MDNANDVYASYEHGLRQLLHQLGRSHPQFTTALSFEQRLRENIAVARQNGDTEQRRAERAEIVARLNELALATLEMSFNELCHGSDTSPAAPAHVPNPFGQTGRITDPAHFFGRDDLLRRIFEELRKGTSLSLVGERQSGKSSLLAMICALGPEQLHLPAEAFVYINMQMIDDSHDFFESLCAEMHMPPMRGGKLARALRGKRFVVCLDEIEKMADTAYFKGAEREQLRGLADGSDAPLTLVIASSLPLDQLFPDRPGMTSPLANVCLPLDVPAFSRAAARDFLAQRLQGTGVTFSAADIDDLLAQSGGNPARLQRAAAELFERRRGVAG